MGASTDEGQGGMEYEAEHRMPAPREVAFDVAADLGRMAAWLPTVVEVRGAGPAQVRVEGQAGGHRYVDEGLIRAQREQLRIEWGSRDSDDYSGYLQFYALGDDASSATLHLSFRGHQDVAHRGAAAEALQGDMETSLSLLAAEIARGSGTGGAGLREPGDAAAPPRPEEAAVSDVDPARPPAPPP